MLRYLYGSMAGTLSMAEGCQQCEPLVGCNVIVM
jgi:hypothetical protein